MPAPTSEGLPPRDTIGEMIASLRGRLIVKTPNQAIVECAGVGYDATISVATFSALPAEGAEARLHIYTHVREDQIALFGFAEMAEKRLFEKLLTISGIGPKLADHRPQRHRFKQAGSRQFAPVTTQPSPAFLESAKKPQSASCWS